MYSSTDNITSSAKLALLSFPFFLFCLQVFVPEMLLAQGQNLYAVSEKKNKQSSYDTVELFIVKFERVFQLEIFLGFFFFLGLLTYSHDSQDSRGRGRLSI